MKRLINLKMFVLALVVALASAAVATPGAVNAQGEMHKHESGGSQEFRSFHDVLHPLMHEALPQKDYKTMRARAGELVKRGRAIVQAGAPHGVTDEAAFRKGLKSFDAELTAFRKAARGKNDAQLEKTFNAVHDTFEMLADMLPPKGSV